MNWYVYSSGLDTDNPPKLTTEQVVALIKDKKIGKNAQVMRSDDPTKSWIKITDTEFTKTFASLKQLESQQKSTEKAQRQAEKDAAQAQRQAEEAAAQAQRQAEEAAAQAQRQTEEAAAQFQEQVAPVQLQQQERVPGKKPNKYRNLRKYLGICTVMTHILFWILIAVAFFGFLFFGIALGPFGLVLSVFGLIITIVILSFWRMCQLAFIEFVRVIMDIEENTRRL
jgi:cation transport ATPase